MNGGVPERGMSERGRLVFWTGLIVLLSASAYLQRFLGGQPPKNLLYRYDNAIGGLIQYLIVGGLILAIAAGRHDLLSLRRPPSWPRALGLALAVLAGVMVVGGWLDSIIHAGREQGLTPTGWEPSKAGQYAANFAVVAIVAPILEELLFRGVGFSLLERYGRWTAIVAGGIAFGAVHGLLGGFVILALFGGALAWLRDRTGTVVPGMLVHGLFNAIALVAAVAT